MRLSEVSQQPALLQQVLLRWFGIAVSLVVAMIIAYWVGTQQTTWLMFCIGITVVALVTGWMRDRAWILIPLGWALTGGSGFIPMGFSVHDVCILLAVCAYIGYRILSPRDLRQKTQLLDVILAINIVWIAITFFRNPIGLRIFGSETIGGRGYFNLVLVLMAYWVMVRLPDSAKSISRIPYFILAGTVVVALVNLVVYLLPAATPWVYAFYTGVDVSAFLYSSPASSEAVTRWSSLAPFGMTLVFVLCALYPPRTLFNPLRLRFYLFALAMAAIMASGFRNSLLWAVVALGLGSWFYHGWREVILGGITAILVLGTVIVGQGRAYQLPLPAQRALCWMPGNWSPLVVAETEQSTEGRFGWWKDVIRYNLVHNWWLGDGFGVAASDFELLRSSRDFLTWMTLTGAFHNGPLTAIRVSGVVGLFLFYIYIITAAVLSVKCVNRCRGTPLQMISIFLAIQLVWGPFHYTLVFGAYDKQLAETMLLVSALLLVMRMREKLPPAATSQAPMVPAKSAAVAA
jgi:hypothetical protein